MNSGVEAPARERCVNDSFWENTKKVRRPAFVEFTISNGMFEGVFMISPQLASDAIIGCHILISRSVLPKGSQTNNYQESVAKQSFLRNFG
jgi:hypothetical protein